MTPEEQQMLGGLVQRVQQTRLTEKDPEAEQMIAQGLGSSSDSLYILAQTVLVQNMALEQAQAQIRQLQQQARQPAPAKATSFLGSLLGHHDPAPPPPAPIQNYPPQQGWQQQSQYGNPQYGNQGYPAAISQPMFSPGSGAGGFLRSAATTAAGVAAGAFAFEGIESLMHGGLGGGGFGGGGFGGGQPVEETVVNNYYDGPGGGERELHREQPASFEDRGDSRLHDAGYQAGGSQDLDTSDINSDLNDASFNDPGDSSDSSDFSSGSDDSLV